MELDYCVIDAFAGVAFEGNPAAVVWLPEAGLLDDAQRQRIAAEFNLAETAYVVPLGPDRFELRWFTPTMEVRSCGHATLASARALQAWGHWRSRVVRFQTRHLGELTCRGDEAGRITMDFPAMPLDATAVPHDAPSVLGIDGPVTWAGVNAMHLTLRVFDAAKVRALAPDLDRLAAWNPTAVCVTAPADDGVHDFVSRFFAPNAGIDEDPVTGTAHCALGPYWAEQLGRHHLRARQLSRRGGTVHLRVQGHRVELAGDSVLTMRGR